MERATSKKGATIWFTGPSGAGKTTVAGLVCELLGARGLPHELLDGDAVRAQLSPGLGFSKQDRDANVRRIGWVCELLTRHGVYACAAVISPYEEVREEVRRRIGRFVLVHCTAALEVLEARDVKGLYRRARQGELRHFTGIDAPYEPPRAPDLVLRSDGDTTAAEAARQVLDLVAARAYL